jgi:hypothetical protein
MTSRSSVLGRIGMGVSIARPDAHHGNVFSDRRWSRQTGQALRAAADPPANAKIPGEGSHRRLCRCSRAVAISSTSPLTPLPAPLRRNSKSSCLPTRPPIPRSSKAASRKKIRSLALPSTIQNTRERVESPKLFDVSAFSAMLQRPRSKFPIVPLLFEVPLLRKFHRASAPRRQGLPPQHRHRQRHHRSHCRRPCIRD